MLEVSQVRRRKVRWGQPEWCGVSSGGRTGLRRTSRNPLGECRQGLRNGSVQLCYEASPGSLTPPCSLCPGVGVPAAAAKAAAKAAKFGESAWGAPQSPRQPWCGIDRCRGCWGWAPRPGTSSHMSTGITPAASPFPPQVPGLECQAQYPVWAECPE